jgi:hypothetical protein
MSWGAVNVRSFIQRIYALNQPVDAWLAGLAAAGEESFGEGLGSYALLLDAHAATARHLLAGEPDDVEAVFDAQGGPVSAHGEAAGEGAVTRALRTRELTAAVRAQLDLGG